MAGGHASGDPMEHRDARRAGDPAGGSGSDAVDAGELHFLLLHYLRGLPTPESADAFERYATSAGLLPRRHDVFGGDHAQSYDELAAKYPHVTHDRLVRLVSQAAARDTGQAGHAIQHKGVLSWPVGRGGTGLADANDVAGALGVGAETLGGVASGTEGYPVSKTGTDFRVAVEAARTFAARVDLTKLTLAALRRGKQSTTCVPVSLLGSRINPLTTIKGHRKELYCVIFDKTGTQIVTGSDDTLVKIWCASTGLLRHSLRGEYFPFPTFRLPD